MIFKNKRRVFSHVMGTGFSQELTCAKSNESWWISSRLSCTSWWGREKDSIIHLARRVTHIDRQPIWLLDTRWRNAKWRIERWGRQATSVASAIHHHLSSSSTMQSAVGVLEEKIVVAPAKWEGPVRSNRPRRGLDTVSAHLLVCCCSSCLVGTRQRLQILTGARQRPTTHTHTLGHHITSSQPIL